MNKIETKHIKTGENRPPFAGEWFLNSQGFPEQARFDLEVISLPILQMRVIEVPDDHVRCQGFIIDDNDPDSWTGCDWKEDCPMCHGSGHHEKGLTEPRMPERSNDNADTN